MPLVVNKVTYGINSDHTDAPCMQSKSSSCDQGKPTSDSKPVPKTSIIIPGAIQIHIEVLLSNAKILKETKIVLYKMFQIDDAIISKSDNDIGQTDHIQIHIAMKPDATPIPA